MRIYDDKYNARGHAEVAAQHAVEAQRLSDDVAELADMGPGAANSERIERANRLMNADARIAAHYGAAKVHSLVAIALSATEHDAAGFEPPKLTPVA